MSMLEWAKNEVAIASKRERGNKPEGEWDYGCACYDSAMRAFESLLGDGHSGMSIGITKNILNRLIDGKPLTPIEDTEDVWNVCSRGKNGGVATYQCKRMSSLFKDVYPDGTVKYHDNDRYYVLNGMILICVGIMGLLVRFIVKCSLLLCLICHLIKRM